MDTSSRSSIFSIVAGDKPVPLARPLVLVGFMAVGKSTIGRLLADRLEVPFADTDAEIERAFGMTVADIFRARGEAEFRNAERRVISALLAGRPMILAAGGGAFVDSETREMLLESATTVWLDTPIELILSRIGRSNDRPLAAGRSEEQLRRLWEERRPCYAQAQVRVEAADDTRRALNQIVAALGRAQV